MNHSFLVFTLAGRRCALPLERALRVLRAVEITPLPHAKLPPQVRGVVNVHGTVVPVFDARETPDDLNENEQMILVQLRDERQALLLCDEVEGVRQVAALEIVSSDALLPQAINGQGEVLSIAGELIYVNDLEALLSGDKWQQLQQHLEQTETAVNAA